MKVIACSLLILLATLAFAQRHQFSADMVDTDKHGGGGTNQSRIYVGAGKIRIDQMAGRPGGMIADYGSQIAYMLMPKEKMYMQMSLQDSKGQLAPSFAFFAPPNPNEPCAQWKKVVTDLTCRKVGTETLNGRSVEKWQGNSAHGHNGYLWFDPKLQFVIKMDDGERMIEFQNIREGTQPANLFIVPSDYKKAN